MSYNEDIGRRRPPSATSPIGTPIIGSYIDGVAQSLRSNQFRPASPIAQPIKPSDGPSLLKRHKVDFSPDEPIMQLSAARNQVLIATKDKKIVMVETTTSKQIDCDIGRYLGNRLMQAKLSKMFLDPSGKFTLISLAYAADNQPMENVLFVKRIQPLPRLKNHLITAVGWNYPKPNSETNPNSTGTILLGTSKGLILQTELIHSDETKFFPLSPGPRRYVKEVFDGGSDPSAITGIAYHQVPTSSTTEKTYFIIFSTSTRLYRMIGSVPANVDPPPLHLIFAQNASSYQEVPGKLNSAKLDLYYPSDNSPPTRFAWLTEPAVMTGVIGTEQANDDYVLVPYNMNNKSNEHLLSSSTPSGVSPYGGIMLASYNDKPISVAVTNFHVIVLFRHCIKAICILNDATVYEEYFSKKYGNILSLTKDPNKNIIWVYFDRAVYRYKISNESKNVWKIYLEQGKFELARKYSSNNATNYDRVMCEEAQYYFRQKDYVRSAEIFALSKKPFEEVSLMFMEIKNLKSLKRYLTIRLDQYDHEQTTQFMMTLAWLFEIIISSMAVLKTQPQSEQKDAELGKLKPELDQLLANTHVVRCLKRHSELFYGIIRSYSDLDTFVRVANIVGDHEHVIRYYVDLGELSKALEVMREVKKNEYFYRYGHILMKRMPKQLVDALVEQSNVNPSEIMPVLIQENAYFNKCSETIRYLKHSVEVLKSDSRVVHNYLFELYARHRDEDTLLAYLNDEVAHQIEADPLLVNQQSALNSSTHLEPSQRGYLDLQLCLRLCTELKLIRTCVILYSSMGLLDEALNLALKLDVELAKGIARRADSEDHQKRLWLSIAQNVLANKPDIQIATGLLRESKLLKIEDILPFFPDYTTIDFFKDAIRQSLQEYKNQIMSLKDGTYDNIADEIRGEIKAFRNRYSIIKVAQRCEICNESLVSRTFFVFPCGHLFHSDCIIKEIMAIDPTYKCIEEKLRLLTVDSAARAPAALALTKSQNFLTSSLSSQTNKTTASATVSAEQRQRLAAELDRIISSECVYCGSLLPGCIDKPPPVDSSGSDLDSAHSA